MAETDAGKQRSFASGVQINLGLLSVTVDIVPVRRPKSKEQVALVSLCPDCDVPTRVTQQYTCVNAHGPYLPAELLKGKETDEGLVRITPEEIKAIAGDNVEGVMDLRVAKREELNEHTRPADSAYRLRLPKRSGKKGGATAAYAVLREMARHPDLALYGVLKINGRTAPTPFRLDEWGCQLILQSLIRPQDLAERDDQEIDAPDEKLVTMALTLMGALSAPFKEEDLADERVSRMSQVLATKTSGATTPALPVAPAPASVDLMAALEASLKAAA